MPGRKKTNDLTKSAFFIALILLLSVTPLGYISLGVISATTIQIPVIIGAVILGWKKGATFHSIGATAVETEVLRRFSSALCREYLSASWRRFSLKRFQKRSSEKE